MFLVILNVVFVHYTTIQMIKYVMMLALIFIVLFGLHMTNNLLYSEESYINIYQTFIFRVQIHGDNIVPTLMN